MQRRTWRLDVAARSATSEAAVVIRNLSRTGLLIETDAAFSLGETFLLVLPELGAAPARVVRADGRLFGCEFLTPVPASAIRDALRPGAHDDAAGNDAAGNEGAAFAEYRRRRTPRPLPCPPVRDVFARGTTDLRG